MSKFIKRLGTAASKFMVELHLTKVELNLVQQCRIAVHLKRGDHMVETRNALALEKGMAKFDEKLMIPATLYKDKKSGVYLPKEATLSINVITPKATRLAGVSKIDLSYYPNNNKTEEDIVHTMEKCFDKNAKLHFHLRMVKVNEVNTERKSMRKKEKDDKSKKEKNNDKSKNRDESEEMKDLTDSPLPSQIPVEGSEVHDFTSNSSLPDISKIDGVRSQNGLGRAKSPPDFNIDDSSDGEQKMVSGRRSRTFDAMKYGANRSEAKDVKGKFFDNALSDATTVNASMNAAQGSQKLIELEVKVKNYQRENKELLDKIREDNEEYMSLNQEYEDLKLKYDRLNRDYENVCSDKNIQKSVASGQDKKLDFELKVYKDKVVQLEREIDDLKKERDEANERADELQEASQELMIKLESYKGKEKSKEGGSSKLEEYLNKNLELTKKLNEAEKKIKELSERKSEGKALNNTDFNELEIENNFLKQRNSDYEAKVEELEKQLSTLQTENATLKKMAKSSASKDREDATQLVMTQLEQMEKKQKGLEDTYKKRIDELTKQNTDLNKELLQAKGAMSSSKFDGENELAKLSLENESLKRQLKDLNSKLINTKYDNKETEDMRRRLMQTEADKEKADAELMKSKMGWASAEAERDDLKSKLKTSDLGVQKERERSEILEKEIFRLRSKIGELMNAVMEYGDEELLDEFEGIMTEDNS